MTNYVKSYEVRTVLKQYCPKTKLPFFANWCEEWEGKLHIKEKEAARIRREENLREEQALKDAIELQEQARRKVREAIEMEQNEARKKQLNERERIIAENQELCAG